MRGSSQEHLGWAGEDRLPHVEAEMGWRPGQFPHPTTWGKPREGLTWLQILLLGFPGVGTDGLAQHRPRTGADCASALSLVPYRLPNSLSPQTTLPGSLKALGLPPSQC